MKDIDVIELKKHVLEYLSTEYVGCARSRLFDIRHESYWIQHRVS